MVMPPLRSLVNQACAVPYVVPVRVRRLSPANWIGTDNTCRSDRGVVLRQHSHRCVLTTRLILLLHQHCKKKRSTRNRWPGRLARLRLTRRRLRTILPPALNLPPSPTLVSLLARTRRSPRFYPRATGPPRRNAATSTPRIRAVGCAGLAPLQHSQRRRRASSATTLTTSLHYPLPSLHPPCRHPLLSRRHPPLILP